MPELKSEFAEFAADAAFSKPEFAKLPIDAAFFKPEFVKLPINTVFFKPEHSGGTIKTQHKFSWLSRAIRFSTGPAGNQEPRGGG